MDDHDKILCERLATTIDHGICKCHERHRIAELEAELDEQTRERERDQEIYKSISDNYFQSVMSPGAYEALEAELATRTRERDEWENRAGIYMSERDAERERRKAAEAMLQAGRDVMAVIHGDGGHYREAHGDRKAADDAINIIIKLRVDLDEEHSRRRIAEAMLLAGCTDAEIDAHFARYKD